MPRFIRIRPVPGRTIQHEEVRTRTITTSCDVPDTMYYRRAIARGDLALDDSSGAVSAPNPNPAME